MDVLEENTHDNNPCLCEMKQDYITVGNIKMSTSINKLSTALAKAQGEIKDAKKNKSNPFLKSKYADIASIIKEIRPSFSSNGLAIVQAPGSTDDGRVTCDTMILHSSGEWLSCSMAQRSDKLTPQAVGSCLTYLRRNMLTSMAVVPTADDDAEGAEDRGVPNMTATVVNANVQRSDMITEKQIESINELFKKQKIPKEKIDESLKKFGVDIVNSLTQSQADLIINRLNGSNKK